MITNEIAHQELRTAHPVLVRAGYLLKASIRLCWSLSILVS